MTTTIFADACFEWKRLQEKLLERFEQITADELDTVEVHGEVCSEADVHLHSLRLACEYVEKIAQRDIRRTLRVSGKYGMDALLDATSTHALLKNVTMVFGDNQPLGSEQLTDSAHFSGGGEYGENTNGSE